MSTDRSSHLAANMPRAPTQTLQLVQGLYYILGGLGVALFIATLQGPADHPRPAPELLPVRVIAVAVIVSGFALLFSRRRAAGFLPSRFGMWVAVILLLEGAAGLALGAIPLTFLLDVALEAVFFVCWAVILFTAERWTTNTPSAVSP